MSMVSWLVKMYLRRYITYITASQLLSSYKVAAGKASGECFEEQHGTTKESVVSDEGQRIAVLGEPGLDSSLLTR